MKKAGLLYPTIIIVLLATSGCDRLAKEAAQRILGKEDPVPSSEPLLPANSNPPLADSASTPSPSEILSDKKISASERLQAAKLTAVTDPDQTKMAKFQAEVRGNFDEGNFDALENLSSSLLKSREKVTPVDWKLSYFYSALEDRHSKGEAGFLNDLETHRVWESRHPNSNTRRLALANLLVSYAWHARGSGYASSVNEEQWKLFHDRIDQAAQELRNAQDSGCEDPHWYRLTMTILKAKSWPNRDIAVLQADCTRSNPDFYPAAASALVSFLPRWGGVPGEWEDFARRASDESEKPDLMYAYLISSLSDYEDAQEAAKNKTIDWERYKKGMDMMTELNPDSKYYPNIAALMGVYAGDRDFSRKYFEKIGDEYIAEVWGKPEKFVTFRSWANSEK